MNSPRRHFPRFLFNSACAYLIAVGGWPLTGETTSLIDPRWRPISCFMAVLLCITANDSLYTWWLHAVELVIEALRALWYMVLRAPRPTTAPVAPLLDNYSTVASESSRGSAASRLDTQQWLHNFCLAGPSSVVTNGSVGESESPSSISLDSGDDTFVRNETGHNGRGDFAWNLELGRFYSPCLRTPSFY